MEIFLTMKDTAWKFIVVTFKYGSKKIDIDFSFPNL